MASDANFGERLARSGMVVGVEVGVGVVVADEEGLAVGGLGVLVTIATQIGLLWISTPK